MGGGERRTFDSLRADGRMCSECHTLIKTPRTCETCKSVRSLMVQWHYADGVWTVTFFDPGVKRPVGRPRRYDRPETIIGLVERSRTPPKGPRRNVFLTEVSTGTGQWPIEVTGEQYRRIAEG